MVDRSHIGFEFPPLMATVEPGRLRFFFKTIGDSKADSFEKYYEEGEARHVIPVPPTYLFCLEMLDCADPLDFIRPLDIDVSRLLHGEQSFVYHAPVHVGDRITFYSKITDVYYKARGALTFAEQDTRAVNQHGDLVAEISRKMIVRNQEKKS